MKAIRIYLLWVILAFPGTMLTIALANGKVEYGMLMHATGEFSARFLVITLVATPLLLMFPKGKFPKWLVRNRVYFGVAAFLYGLYHTIYYVWYEDASKIIGEFLDPSILSGWIAMFIFTPLALTSNAASVRWLKAKWKKLHNWTHLAAIMIIIHWVMIHDNYMPAIVHFGPVLLLQVYRVIKQSKASRL